MNVKVHHLSFDNSGKSIMNLGGREVIEGKGLKGKLVNGFP